MTHEPGTTITPLEQDSQTTTLRAFRLQIRGLKTCLLALAPPEVPAEVLFRDREPTREEAMSLVLNEVSRTLGQVEDLVTLVITPGSREGNPQDLDPFIDAQLRATRPRDPLSPQA